jgi:23S rRNA (guanosine2251-2'-O)-methyltransferase
VREILYGRNAVCEALRAGRRKFFQLRIAETVRASGKVQEAISLAEASSTPCAKVPRQDLDQLGEFNHQGVVLEASGYPYTDLGEILEQADQSGAPPFLLLLDLLQDTHNLGSLLRTAEAVGIGGAVIQRRRAAEITPTVVNTSAGAVEHLKIAQVSNIAQTISALKERQIWVYGLEAAPGAQRYDQIDLRGPLALVVGSEGQGLRRLVRERCDLLVELPMLGEISSLNAAVAGSILLYEALRQRTPVT